jgi:zinc/manganese transport system substrate-binding protein
MGRGALVLGFLLLAACGTTTAAPSATINVVAGENFWGSIASQLGGSRVRVQSVVTDPNADPHEYESSTNDARAFAEAKLVILNGAGYDVWGKKLLDANPANDRRVLDIAEMLGKKEGDNPHFWYDPGYVSRVAADREVPAVRE